MNKKDYSISFICVLIVKPNFNISKGAYSQLSASPKQTLYLTDPSVMPKIGFVPLVSILRAVPSKTEVFLHSL